MLPNIPNVFGFVQNSENFVKALKGSKQVAPFLIIDRVVKFFPVLDSLERELTALARLALTRLEPVVGARQEGVDQARLP